MMSNAQPPLCSQQNLPTCNRLAGQAGVDDTRSLQVLDEIEDEAVAAFRR